MIVAREVMFNDRALYSIMTRKPATLKIRYVGIEDMSNFEEEMIEKGAQIVEQFCISNAEVNWEGFPLGEFDDTIFNITAEMLEKVRGRTMVTSEDGNTMYFPGIGIYSTSNPSVKIPKRVMNGEFVEWDYDYLIHTDRRVDLELAAMFKIEVPDILKETPTRETNLGRIFPRNLFQHLMKEYYYEKLKVRAILAVIRTYDGLILAESEFWRIFQGSRLNDKETESYRKITLKGDYEPISFPELLRQMDINQETLVKLLDNSKEEFYGEINEEYIAVFEAFRKTKDSMPEESLVMYEEYEMNRIDLRFLINILQDVFYDSMGNVLAFLPMYNINTEYMSVHQDTIKWKSDGDEFKIRFSYAKPEINIGSLDFHN